MDYTTYIIKQRQYSVELKHKICKEHIEQGTSLSDLVRKYDLSSHSLIHDWLRKLGYLPANHRQISKRLYLGVEHLDQFQMATPNSTPAGSKTRCDDSEIIGLKRELEEAQIQLEGYQRMIELAESEFNIPIRKKYSTK